jgi:sugar lactone lactonase YvrE
MIRRFRNLFTVPVALALSIAAAVAPAAVAAPPFPDRIDLPNGWAPEGITAGPGTTVFVGSLATGAIWQGDVRTGDGSVFVQPDVEHPFVAVGTEYDAATDRLWVAGGPTGQVRVYDGSSGELLETYTFSPAVFLNDLVVTDDAVYVTDSGIQQLDVIPLGPGGELPDPDDVETLPLSGDIEFQQGFNTNGIEEARGWLIVVQTNTGQLFRVDPATGEATEIDLGGESVTNGDGLLVHGSTLYVVRNQLNLVAAFKLGPGLESATFLGNITSAGLAVPTTVARVAGSLYAVNARFGTPVTPGTEYWITRLPTTP